MFSKNLSLSILHLCSSRDLSYEKAAELCGLSPRYFGSVARGQTNASIIALEKLCKGFELTPNELLRVPPRCRIPGCPWLLRRDALSADLAAVPYARTVN